MHTHTYFHVSHKPHNNSKDIGKHTITLPSGAVIFVFGASKGTYCSAYKSQNYLTQIRPNRANTDLHACTRIQTSKHTSNIDSLTICQRLVKRWRIVLACVVDIKIFISLSWCVCNVTVLVRERFRCTCIAHTLHVSFLFTSHVRFRFDSLRIGYCSFFHHSLLASMSTYSHIKAALGSCCSDLMYVHCLPTFELDAFGFHAANAEHLNDLTSADSLGSLKTPSICRVQRSETA